MTREETITVLSVLRGAYQNFYRESTKEEAKDTINLWASLFAGDDYTVVCAAVKSFIAGDIKGFPPVPGQIKAYIRTLTQPKGMTEGEAWALIAKAVRNSGYESVKEFEKLPEDLQKIVGSPEQLHDWSQMDSDALHSVVASNVQRAYRVKKQEKERYAALPEDVKTVISAASDKMRLTEGKG